MAFHQELGQGVLAVVLVTGVFLVAIAYAQGTEPPPASSSESPQIGKVLSVRKVLRNPYFFSRYPRIHYYLLYFAVRASGQTYCSEYETPVLDEIDDLFSAKDKDVEFVLKGKSLTLRTPKGRKLKAHLVDEKQC
ncbi:MAG: hypothetical protein ABSG40_09575 [Terriglobales bacterium]|jgi:hypothetical protein